MSAMEWVQEIQQANNCSWDIHNSVAHVKASIARSKGDSRIGWGTGLRKYMANSRAVRANGPYRNLASIPNDFAQVVFGGAKGSHFFGGNVRALTIGGFLAPERNTSGQEFVRYDWTDPEARYGVANSLMAEYYGDVLSAEPYNLQAKTTQQNIQHCF